MTTKEYQQYIADCLGFLPWVRYRFMMGGYVVYYHEKVIGDICDNRLLIKITPTAEKLLPNALRDYPYEGSKTQMLVIEEPENRELTERLLQAVYSELPDKKR